MLNSLDWFTHVIFQEKYKGNIKNMSLSIWKTK